ncbi:MAG: type II toxin-antitoxin system RelE/ParE family toxin [Planctomycetota bacterium]
MPDFTLRPAARADLDGIWDYTQRTWGESQADAYVRSLAAAFHALSAAPDLGRPRDELHPGLRVFRSGKHLIFYLAVDPLDVVRVLHERMDAGPRLGGSLGGA